MMITDVMMTDVMLVDMIIDDMASSLIMFIIGCHSEERYVYIKVSEEINTVSNRGTITIVSRSVNLKSVVLYSSLFSNLLRAE